MKITFMSKKKKENKIITYNPDKETVLDITVEPNKYIFPVMRVNEENSNVSWIGYIKESNQLFIQYKTLTKSVDGYDIGIKDEPIGYFYHNVPEEIYNNLVKSKSKSNYINNVINKNFNFFHREFIDSI